MTFLKVRRSGILSMKPMAWLVGSMLVAAVVFAPTAAQGQASWSVSDCASCHDKALSPAFSKSAHARVEQSCAKCHNNVAEHLKAQSEGKDGPVPSLKNVKVADQNATCLSCHEKAAQESYMSGMHARRNVSCNSCHSVHTPKSATGQLKTKKETELCYSCHKTERAKMNRTSRHPVREGKMSCSSCHNVHEGNNPKMVKAETVTELCYQCHTEKRGPFLFEHAPVRENCVACHDAHGSNHNRMLVQKQPTLCYSCHFSGSGHFGSGDNFSTEKGVPAAPTGSPSGYPTVNSRFIGRACTKCHMNIHGSNAPSGAFFVR